VVFGGGVSRCYPQIEPVFSEELRRRTPVFSLPWTRVVPSRFGAQAGVLGAAMLPRNRAE
jgi:predicted NBD/HSP70 family sugar kinase